jgi:uncharacterized membrane protein
MKYIVTNNITINADISKVYDLWTDVENWNLWTKSINKISLLDNEKFEIGGKVRIEQPKLSPALWTITEIQPNIRFTWQTKMMGVTVIAKHILQSTPNGTIAKSELTYDGLLAGFLYRLFLKLTSQYLIMEIEGLKNECEKIK